MIMSRVDNTATYSTRNSLLIHDTNVEHATFLWRLFQGCEPQALQNCEKLDIYFPVAISAAYTVSATIIIRLSQTGTCSKPKKTNLIKTMVDV